MWAILNMHVLNRIVFTLKIEVFLEILFFQNQRFYTFHVIYWSNFWFIEHKFITKYFSMILIKVLQSKIDEDILEGVKMIPLGVYIDQNTLVLSWYFDTWYRILVFRMLIWTRVVDSFIVRIYGIIIEIRKMLFNVKRLSQENTYLNTIIRMTVAN